MYHFFISNENIKDGKVYIQGADVNHIKNVLRLKKGDALLISDGAGNDYSSVIDEFTDDEVVCLISDAKENLSEPETNFYLFQGLPKSDKFEHIIQKSVELGVHEIIPVMTGRSIVKYDEKKKNSKKERWIKISESAAKQSRRGMIPDVKDIMSFDEAISYANALTGGHERENGIILFPYENYKDIEKTRKIINGIKPCMDVCIFVGPEGGFEESEVKKAYEAGFEFISLGNRILRTETAPLMLLSILSFNLS